MKRKIKFFVVMALMSLLFVACGSETDEDSVGTYDEAESMQEPEIMSDNTVIRETIEIPGLSKEYNFLYMTDTHLVLLDGTETEEVTQYAMERWDNFAHDNAFPIEEQMEIWFAEAEQAQFDGILLGGDIIDFPSDANVNYLEEHLSTLSMPYLYAIGNHDWTYPWEYMTEYGKENYLTKLYPYMQSNPAIHQLEFDEFIIVAVDDCSNQVAPEVMETYKEVLQKGKPVIVVLHVPLLTQSVLAKAREAWTSGVVLGGGNIGGLFPNEVSTEFINLTTAEDSPVVAVLAGHVHFYDRDMINENIVQLVGDGGYKGQAMWITITSGDEQ